MQLTVSLSRSKGPSPLEYGQRGCFTACTGFVNDVFIFFG
jgi:hypothetical protein